MFHCLPRITLPFDACFQAVDDAIDDILEADSNGTVVEEKMDLPAATPDISGAEAEEGE